MAIITIITVEKLVAMMTYRWMLSEKDRTMAARSCRTAYPRSMFGRHLVPFRSFTWAHMRALSRITPFHRPHPHHHHRQCHLSPQRWWRWVIHTVHHHRLPPHRLLRYYCHQHQHHHHRCHRHRLLTTCFDPRIWRICSRRDLLGGRTMVMMNRVVVEMIPDNRCTTAATMATTVVQAVTKLWRIKTRVRDTRNRTDTRRATTQRNNATTTIWGIRRSIPVIPPLGVKSQTGQLFQRSNPWHLQFFGIYL